MKNITVALDKLTPDPRNARTHPPQQVARLAGSIKEFGFLQPVIINEDNRIIAGHGRVEAARTAGLEKVPCIQVDHLSETQERAYVLADNKLAQMAEWDLDMLENEVKALQGLDFDLDVTGFTEEEIQQELGSLKEVTDLDHHSMTMKERQEGYDESAFRQIILIYQADEYDAVINALGDYAEQNGLSDNCEVVNHLLETNGYAVSRQEAEED